MLETLSERFHPNTTAGSSSSISGGGGGGRAGAGGVCGQILNVLLGEPDGICVMKTSPFPASTTVPTAGGGGTGRGADEDSTLQMLEEGGGGSTLSSTVYIANQSLEQAVSTLQNGGKGYSSIPNTLKESFSFTARDVGAATTATTFHTDIAPDRESKASNDNQKSVYLYLHTKPTVSDATLRCFMRHMDVGHDPSGIDLGRKGKPVSSVDKSVVSFYEANAPKRDNMKGKNDSMTKYIWNVCPIL